MWRKIRITCALVVFTLVTLLFLDFTGTVHPWFGWLAKIQFLPALLALHVGVVVVLLLLTLLLGRVYCSVLCPLGVFQDLISWLSGRRKSRRNRFSYSPAKSWLRYLVLLLFVVAMLAGVGTILSTVALLIAPYSAYGRIAQNLFAPLWQWGNNGLALWAEQADSYAFYETTVWMRSLPTFLVACVTFLVIVFLAWRGGRTYCNTICPVGTLLGFFSRYALLRPVIDVSKCNNCTLCSRRCKASCIDSRNHSIDYSRCVTCFDCIDTCRHGAIRYTLRRPSGSAASPSAAPSSASSPSASVDSGRRHFLTGTGLLAGTWALQAQEKKVDGGLALLLDKQVPHRTTPIVPPGAQSLRNLANHCTACQLCVAVCPNEVLRPSTRLESLMQPESSYERGYCRPECTRCADVCPAGAIRPITVAEKSSIQIGHAVWVKANCIPLTEGDACGNCARHCPTGAITMVPSKADDPASPQIPVVNEERCIGCGACEHLCPARPFSAIYVEGHENHRFV